MGTIVPSDWGSYCPYTFWYSVFLADSFFYPHTSEEWLEGFDWTFDSCFEVAFVGFILCWFWDFNWFGIVQFILFRHSMDLLVQFCLYCCTVLITCSLTTTMFLFTIKIVFLLSSFVGSKMMLKMGSVLFKSQHLKWTEFFCKGKSWKVITSLKPYSIYLWGDKD